jgi:hypothetical protein
VVMRTSLCRELSARLRPARSAKATALTRPRRPVAHCRADARESITATALWLPTANRLLLARPGTGEANNARSEGELRAHAQAVGTSSCVTVLGRLPGLATGLLTGFTCRQRAWVFAATTSPAVLVALAGGRRRGRVRVPGSSSRSGRSRPA